MRHALLLTTAVIAVISPSTAYAASAQPADEASVASSTVVDDGAIVVTARRRAEDASKVPISVTAFSADTLEKRNINYLGDIVKITPGLNISTGATRVNPFVTIRGQSKGITGNIQPGVIIYQNDVPMNNYGALVPTYDIANVQVLKGPQGTLFGRNAMGGAILVNTAQPNYNFGGYAKVDFASYNFKQIEGSVNVPIIADRVALRVASQVFHDGGAYNTLYVPNYTTSGGVATPGKITPTGRNLDEFLGKSVRASLRLDPVDGITNVTVVDYTHLRGTPNIVLGNFYPTGFNGATAVYWRAPGTITTALGATLGGNVLALTACGQLACDKTAAQAYAQASDRAVMTNVDPWSSRTRVWGINNTTTVQLGDNTTLKNIVGYRDVDSFSNTDVDGTTLSIITSASQVRLKQFTDELQLSGSLFNNALKYTVGGFYYSETPSGPGGQQGLETNALFGLAHTMAFTYLHNKSKALYGQVDWSLDPVVPGLTLTAGARQTWDSVGGCAASIGMSPTATSMLVTTGNSPYMLTEAQCQANSGTTAGWPGSTSVLGQNLPTQKFDKLTYTLGANWQITPGAMVYVTHRRGYRAGSYNTPIFDPAFLSQLQTFAPETIEDWEAGAKVRWQAGTVRGSFDIAAFTGKDKNLQMPITTSSLTNRCVPQAITATRVTNCVTGAGNAPGIAAGQNGVLISHSAPRTIVNAGQATIRGFEVAASLTPFEGVTLSGTLAYLDYKFDSLSIDANLKALLASGGLTVPTTATAVLEQQPKWTYTLALDVVLPGRVLDSNVSFSANYKHGDNYRMGDIDIGGFNVADARLTFGDIGKSGVDVALYVRNLTNEKYILGGATTGPGSLGQTSWTQSAPRSFGMSARYKFGS